MAKPQKQTQEERARGVAIRRCAYLGMSPDEFAAHVAEHGGTRNTKSPMAKFLQHKYNAAVRGIKFEFIFADWWRIWQESGKWAQRGQGKGYVMARHNDGDTPYSPSTVYICSGTQNMKDGFAIWPAAERFANRVSRIGTGRGYSITSNTKNPYTVVLMKRYIGSYPTAELARAAHLAAVDEYRLARATDGQGAKDSPPKKVIAEPKSRIGTGRGVFPNRSKSNPYRVLFRHKHLGCFPTPELARAAYLAAAEEYKRTQP